MIQIEYDAYWPDRDTVVYGNLQVIYVDTETYGDFDIRTFYMKYGVSIFNLDGQCSNYFG